MNAKELRDERDKSREDWIQYEIAALLAEIRDKLEEVRARSVFEQVFGK